MRKCMNGMRKSRVLPLLILLLALAGCGGPEDAAPPDGGDAGAPVPYAAAEPRAPVVPPAEDGPEHLPTDGETAPEGGHLPVDPETPPGPSRPLDGGAK